MSFVRAVENLPRQADAVFESGEAYIGADGVEDGPIVECRQERGFLRIGFLQPRECLVSIGECRIDESHRAQTHRLPMRKAQ